MFLDLEAINKRPRPFEFYTAEELWNDDHTSAQMLKYHLDPKVDMSSRNHAFIDRSVDWIAARFNLGTGAEVADFGCGPGLYASRLARLGADVTGIDVSRRSIQYALETAEKEGLKISYVNRNYLEYVAGNPFDLIIMIFCDFCVLSPDQRKKLLANFRSSLKPGGSVLLDVSSLAAYDRREEQAVYQVNILDGFWSPDKYYGFLNTFKYDAEKVVLDKYTIIEPGRTRTIYNWLQYFGRQELEKEFVGGGFRIEEFYSDVAGTPFDSNGDQFAVVAVAE
jgi:cyclopropane fatty-acyl-phospholipid synthase-like methyltransferase